MWGLSARDGTVSSATACACSASRVTNTRLQPRHSCSEPDFKRISVLGLGIIGDLANQVSQSLRTCAYKAAHSIENALTSLFSSSIDPSESRPAPSFARDFLFTTSVSSPPIM